MSDCNDFVGNMAIKLQTKDDKKKFTTVINRMKKKQMDILYIFLKMIQFNIFYQQNNKSIQ